MKTQGIRVWMAAMVVAGMTTLNGSALIVYQQNFDSLALGTINGQDAWSGGAQDVVQNAVAVSGNALMLDGSGAYRSNVFMTPTAGSPLQQITFEMRLAQTINDFAGQANIDIQHQFQVRCPDANQNNEYYLIYKANTNGAGAVTKNDLEIRGSNATYLIGGVEKDVWYQVTMDFNFGAKTCDVAVTKAGAPWWNPLPVTGYNNGNINMIGPAADGDPNTQYYMDNLVVSVIPEPASAVLLLLGALPLLRRRRQ